MKRLVAGVLLVAVAVGMAAVPAGAGGWAVSSLDDVPAPEAGRPMEVGWTIRQHGVAAVLLAVAVADLARARRRSRLGAPV